MHMYWNLVAATFKPRYNEPKYNEISVIMKSLKNGVAIDMVLQINLYNTFSGITNLILLQ